MYREPAALSVTPRTAMIALLKSRRVMSWIDRGWLRRCLLGREEADIASDHDIRKAMQVLIELGFTREELVAAFDALELERPRADWT